MVRRRKFQFYFFIGLTISIILILKFIKNKINSELDIEAQSVRRIYSIKNVHFHSSNVWIFNYNATQYSSIFSSKQTSDEIQTESLTLFDHEDIYTISYLNENIQCLIQINQNQTFFIKPIQIMKIDLMPVNGKPKSLFKIKCIFIYKPNDIKILHVSIIDSKMFDLKE